MAQLETKGLVSPLHKVTRRHLGALQPRSPYLARSKRTVHCFASAASDTLSEQVVVVLGTQWGDEGKGKLVDILARQYDIVARAQVWPCWIADNERKGGRQGYFLESLLHQDSERHWADV